MSTPGRITTRTSLIEAIYRLCPSRACQRAIRAGNVEVLGGFDTIPPFGLPGWVCSVRSRHGRTWLLSLLADDVRHTYECKLLDKVPWDQWSGRKDAEKGSPYHGDKPKEAARLREKARLVASIRRSSNPLDDSDTDMGGSSVRHPS